MKVQISVKTLTAELVTLDLAVGPCDTVLAIKERIAEAEPNPFPDRVLSLKGEPLQDAKRLGECGVQDGGSLDFECKVSEEALVAQFKELLVSGAPMSIEEAGLVYALAHGVTVGAALGALGKEQLLQAFFERLDKHFVLQDGEVRLACPPLEPSAKAAAPLAKIPEDDSVQQLSLVVNVAIALPYEVCHSGAVTVTASSVDRVASVKEKVCALEQIPFAEHTLSLGGKLLDDGATLARCGLAASNALDFVVHASEDALAHQMAAILRSRGPLSKADLDDLFCCRYGLGAGGALKMLGWGEKFLPFLQRHPLFSVTSGCVALAPDSLPPSSPEPVDNQQFLDLHAKLCADCQQPKLRESVARLVETLADTAFLNIRRVATGGGLANGTAIRGALGAKVVLFLEGLPSTGHERWLPGLVSSMSGALADRAEEIGAATVGLDDFGGLRVCTSGELGEVQVLFSPDYACTSDALAALRDQGDASQYSAAASLVEQKVRFVSRQPEGVKATVRVVKWWRERLQWSSDAAKPTDDLLELVVAHTLAQRAPRNLAAAVSNVLSVLARFDELNATWPLASRSYREGDIPKELLKQRPLLLDPVNPFVNVAGPQHFQPEEMIAHAKTGSFFI